MDKPSVAILAGGASRRMGRDKATVLFDGISMLQRVAAAAVGAGLKTVIVGRTRPEDWPFDEVSWIPDERPGEGPLTALATALRYVDSGVIAVACDMPLLNSDVFRWMSAMVEQSRPVDSILTLNDLQPEPLFSYYSRGLLPYIDTMLESGERSLLSVMVDCERDALEAPQWVAERLRNFNTPEELKAKGPDKRRAQRPGWRR